MSTFPWITRTQTDPYDSNGWNADDANATLGSHTVFRALFNQSGTSAPVLTILENNTGITFTASRGTVGNYLFTPSINFVPSKVLVICGSGGSLSGNLSITYYIQTTYLEIDVVDASGTGVDGRLQNMAIQLLIYP